MRTLPWLHTCLALAIALAAAGCTSLAQPGDAMLTYETAPAGATIFESGLSLGVAPVTRTYPHDGKSTSIRTPEVTAVWPSGAKASFWTLLPAGADRVATIERPSGAPGLQADLDHAARLAHVTKANDVREIEAPEDHRLTPKLLELGLRDGGGGEDRLQRDHGLIGLADRAIHHPHATTPKLIHNQVTINRLLALSDQLTEIRWQVLPRGQRRSSR